MKKSLAWLLLFFLLLFVGCGTNNKDSVITFESGIYFNKNWDEEIGTYQMDVVPNQDVAVNVATQIFEGIEKSDRASEYIAQYVFFDEQDEIWIVGFWHPNALQEGIAGGDCSIAIRKSDGLVLRIWFGE